MKKMNTDERKHAYIGHTSDLQRLKSEWTDHRIFGIYGMRSIGKSSFVRTFLENELDCTDMKCIWTNVKNNANVLKIKTNLFIELGIYPSDDILPISSLSDAIESLGKPLVIVLDSVEEILERGQQGDFLNFCSTLILHCTNMKLVVTSSMELSFKELEQLYFKLTLSPMSVVDSKKLMCYYAPSVNFGSYLETVVGLCDGLPLALLMVAVELEDECNLLSVEDMVQLLMDCRLSILSQEFYPSQERIAVVYGEFLRRLGATFQDRLAMLGYIPGSFTLGQAKEILGHATEEETKEETLKPIIARHVIHEDIDSARYDIHGILRDCIDIFLHVKNIEVVRQRFCSTFTKILTDIGNKLNTAEYMEALCLYNIEQQNFRKLFNDVIYSNEDTYQFYMEIVVMPSNAFLRLAAGEMFGFCIELMRLANSYGKLMDRAYIQLQYGSALTNIQEDLNLGEKNYLEAVQFIENFRKVHGNRMDGSYPGLGKDNRVLLATCYQRIGWNKLQQGGRHYHEALPFLEKAFSLENELKMYLDELILSTIQSLGVTCQYIGRLEEALKYQQEAMKRRLVLYKTKQHPAMGGIFNNIGLILYDMGKKEEALQHYEQGLRIKRETKATDKAIVLSLTNVALTLSDLNRHDQAVSTILEAERILSNYPGLFLQVAVHANNIKRIVYRRRDKSLLTIT